MANEIREQVGYSEEHEWVLDLGDGTVKIGISDLAQHRLGDIVFVELPDPGQEIEMDDVIGTIESVKTVADLFTPVSGIVLEINGGNWRVRRSLSMKSLMMGAGWCIFG